MGYENEIWLLRQRVRELEKQVEQLRTSRRILMNLVEKLEQERRFSLSKLEKENKKLTQNNKRYAARLMKYNCYLVEKGIMEDL